MKRNNSFIRFCLSGVFFTTLGPGLLWLAYPLGAFLAVGISELLAHSLRFVSFRWFVFPASKGYKVTAKRYLLSAVPVSLANLLTVTFLRNQLDRTTLTFSVVLISLSVGFVWSRFVYTVPRSN
jgi:putative flippase GtrA